MTIRRKALATAAALMLGLTGAVASSAPATWAHDYKAGVDCSSATVNLTNYDKGATAEVILDGVTIHTGTFNGNYSLNKKLTSTEDAQTHSLKVTVISNDGAQYNFNFDKTVEGCYTGPKTITVPNFDASPPTCDTAGYINQLGKSTGPAQNPNGYEFLGEGFRVYISPAYQPGAATAIEYTLTFQKVGPNFDPAYPNGTKVIGNTTQKITVLPAIGYQTADANAPCFNRPDTPVLEDKIVVTEEAPDCLTDTVAGNIATTAYTFTWNEETKSFDRTEVTTNVATSRPATYDEIVVCNPLPENHSVKGETTTDEVACGITEAPTHTAYTDYTYTRDITGHVVETTNERVEDGTRTLDASEVKVCPIVIPPNPITPTGAVIPVPPALVTTGAMAGPALLTALALLTLGSTGLIALTVRRRREARNIEA